MDLRQCYPSVEQLRHRIEKDKEFIEKYPNSREMLQRKFAKDERLLATLPGRIFVQDVMALAQRHGVSCFVVTDGASGTLNNGSDAVKHARIAHVEWEKVNGIDPFHDWTAE